MCCYWENFTVHLAWTTFLVLGLMPGSTLSQHATFDTVNLSLQLVSYSLNSAQHSRVVNMNSVHLQSVTSLSHQHDSACAVLLAASYTGLQAFMHILHQIMRFVSRIMSTVVWRQWTTCPSRSSQLLNECHDRWQQNLTQQWFKHSRLWVTPWRYSALWDGRDHGIVLCPQL